MALLVVCAGPWPATGQSPAAPQPPSRRVLILFGESRLIPAIATIDGAFRSTLASRSPVPVSFYTEYLDLSLFDGPVPLPELRELIRRKYATRPLDLILAVGSPALRF